MMKTALALLKQQQLMEWMEYFFFLTQRQCVRFNGGFVSLSFTLLTWSQTFRFARSAILANNWPGGFDSIVLNQTYCVSDVHGLYGLDLNGVTLHYVVAPTGLGSRIDKLLIGCVLKKSGTMVLIRIPTAHVFPSLSRNVKLSHSDGQRCGVAMVSIVHQEMLEGSKRKWLTERHRGDA